MKKIYIEDVKVGTEEGGMPCGVGRVVAEARIRNEKGEVLYYGLEEMDGTASFFKSNESRYEQMLDIESDLEYEDIAAEGYTDYEDFFEELQEIEKKDKSHALLLKYLVCLVRLDWDATNELKANSIGKELGSFDIPVCDVEEEMLDEED